MSNDVEAVFTDAVFNDGGPPLTRLQNLVRAAKGFALLFFLMPWVTVSCNGSPLMKATGLQMMTGNMSMTNPMTGQAERQGDGFNPYVLVAFVILAGLLVLGFVWKNRAALLAGLVGCIVSLGALIFGVAVKSQTAMAEARAKMDADMGSGPGGADEFGRSMDEFGRNMANAISIDLNIGYWMTIFAIAAAAWFYWVMIKGRGNFDRAAATAPPAPPPPVE